MRRHCYRAKRIADAFLSAGIALTVGIATLSLLVGPAASSAADVSKQRRAVPVPASYAAPLRSHDGSTGTKPTAKRIMRDAGKRSTEASTAGRPAMVRLPGHELSALHGATPVPKASRQFVAGQPNHG